MGDLGNGLCATCGRAHVQGVWMPRHPYRPQVRVAVEAPPSARVHRLKTWPDPLRAVRRGEKLFEVRCNDRDYQPGDKVVLFGWDPITQKDMPAEEPVCADVGYVLRGPAFGIPEGHCVFSLVDASTRHGLIKPAVHRVGGAEGGRDG